MLAALSSSRALFSCLHVLVQASLQAVVPHFFLASDSEPESAITAASHFVTNRGV